MYQIAIDGPSGAGKSTVAKALAKQLNILYLDTGAMYRALTYFALQRRVETADSAAVLALLADFTIEFKDDAVYCEGVDVSDAIRTAAVTTRVSEVSAIEQVRTYMVKRQREIAGQRACVLDGRDIGTVVLPNAKYKYYITASDFVRAKRRYDEQLLRGYDVTLEDVLKDIRRRDLYDSTRQHAPLKVADDALVIDTTNLTVAQVVAKILENVKEEA